MTVDYSQIEMRIMAHLSGDEALIEAFRSHHDFHAETAARVFGVDAARGHGPERRAKIKAMNYGLAYGLSAFGLSNQLRISTEEARGLMDELLRDASAVCGTTSAESSTRRGRTATPRRSSAGAATCPT